MLLAIAICLVGCNTQEVQEEEKQTEIRQQNMRSIVDIYTTYPGETEGSVFNSFGSGVILDKTENGDVYIATNLHVVSGGLKADGQYEEGSSATVSFHGAGKNNGIQAEVIGFYKNFDIAVLFVEEFAKKFPIICPIDTTVVVVPEETDTIRVVGNALGKGVSVTEGIVSVASEYIGMSVSYQFEPITIRQIRVDASMNQGCSGGGVFSKGGEFIGMVNARSSKEGVDDFGYVIPSATVLPLCSKIIEKHKTGSGEVALFNFGAKFVESNPTFTWVEEDSLIKSEYLVLVSEVSVGKIASVFLEKDDIVKSITVNQKEYLLSREYEVNNVCYQIKTGDQITVKYIRSGISLEYAFTVDQSYMVKN